MEQGSLDLAMLSLYVPVQGSAAQSEAANPKTASKSIVLRMRNILPSERWLKVCEMIGVNTGRLGD
jgi:hypothetical protein